MERSILSVAAVRRREGGATLLSTGSHGSWVGFRHPEIRRIELCSWVSMRFVWLDLAHTGQQYSIKNSNNDRHMDFIQTFQFVSPWLRLASTVEHSTNFKL